MSALVDRWMYRAASFAQNPQAMLLRRKGVISDLYLKLDQPWIHALEVRTVLDIGANIGRFSKTIEHLFPQAQIFAFEPLPSCFAEMNTLMAEHRNFTAFNVGLGDASSQLEILESDHAPSSSFLEIGDLHKSAFPRAANQTKRVVQVERLDDMQDQMRLDPTVVIKVDVQGFEDKVLAGGKQVFAQAKLLVLELSFSSLYEGQPLFDDIYQVLKELGFSYRGGISLMKHPRTGMPLDADCLFVNETI